MAKFNYKQTKEVPVLQQRFIPLNGWNNYCENIFNAVTNTFDNIVIQASPGSGKTTVSVESALRYREKFPRANILACSFAKNLKEELETKLSSEQFDILTVHGLGFQAVKNNWQGVILDKYGTAIENLVQSYIGPEDEKKNDREELKRLVRMAKTCFVSSLDEIISLIDQFEIKSSITKQQLAGYVSGWDDESGKHHKGILEITKFSPLRLEIGKKVFRCISFEDMIWLPIVHKWKPNQYDMIFIDEVQDLSEARRQLVYSAKKENGRIVAAGDINQTIYSWAGADQESLPKLIKDLDAKLLPLPVSWRCAKKIVDEALTIIPNSIEAAPNAKEGFVGNCNSEEMINLVNIGDVIISRTNAPLVKLFFILAKSGKDTVMLGKEFGAILSNRIRKWAPNSLQKLIDFNHEWKDNELNKREKKLPGMKSEQRILDEFEIIDLFCQNFSSVKDIINSLEKSFSPDEDKNNTSNKNKITLTSTHKFKGLERERVFVLKDTYKPFSTQEETNLLFVAVTRSISQLFYVSKGSK
jgi:superfamily I DNA/RNA helicase